MYLFLPSFRYLKAGNVTLSSDCLAIIDRSNPNSTLNSIVVVVVVVVIVIVSEFHFICI